MSINQITIGDISYLPLKPTLNSEIFIKNY